MMQLLYKRPDGTFVADLGFGPYHVIPDDAVAPAGLWDWAVGEAARLGDDLQLEPPPPPPVVTVPASISFVQLLIGLVAEQWITEAEGEAWMNGTLPAGLLALIGQLPEEHRFPAKMRALRATTVPRQDPLALMMATALGKEDDLDAFFTTYGAI